VKIHSIVVGVILVVASVLMADNVQGQSKATGNGIDAHVRTMLENGRRVFRFVPSAAKPSGARRSSSTEPSPARRMEVSAAA